MAASFEGHNEEASLTLVDKKKLVDMLENSSKIWQERTLCYYRRGLLVGAQ